MSVLSAFAIYFLIWWVVLFAVLPFGVRSQAEDGAVEEGTDPGAPSKPMLWRKIGATTLISGLIYLGLVWAYRSGVTLESIPLLPDF